MYRLPVLYEMHIRQPGNEKFVHIRTSVYMNDDVGIFPANISNQLLEHLGLVVR
jgi:hypothetical protein